MRPRPSPEAEALRAGSARAPCDLIAAEYPGLLEWLARRNPSAAPEFREEAAQEAMLSLIKDPSSFAPSRGKSLRSYLRMAADGDLKNLLRREAKHHRRRRPWSDVELSPDAGKYIGVEEDPALRLYIAEAKAPALDGLSPQEQAALDLLRAGERRTSEYAEAMGWSHLPAPEQRSEVKKLKDRLNKRLRRAEGKREQLD